MARRLNLEAGSNLRLIDSCITQLKTQGPSRTCNESKEEEEDLEGDRRQRLRLGVLFHDGDVIRVAHKWPHVHVFGRSFRNPQRCMRVYRLAGRGRRGQFVVVRNRSLDGRQAGFLGRSVAETGKDSRFAITLGPYGLGAGVGMVVALQHRYTCSL